jgi:hypothetical protein
MSTAQEALTRINRSSDRIDALLSARADAADSAAEQERRDTMRRYADRCSQHQRNYDDAFAAFGKRAPQAAADAFPPDYRRDLFKTGQSYLPSDHPLSGVDPHEEIGPSAIETMEKQLFDALREQAARPTGDNRADSVFDPKARRVVVDPDTGQRVTTFIAKNSFIKNFAARPLRVRFVDHKTGRVMAGPPWSAQELSSLRRVGE